MKLLYTNGDSWTDGNEMEDPSGVDDKNYRYYNTWPIKLAENLDIPLCVNEAAGGTSNLRIFRKTTDFIFNWVDKNKKPTDLMIILGWTTPERTEIGVNDTIVPLRVQPDCLNKISDKKVLRYYHGSFYKLYADSYHLEMMIRYMRNLRLLCKGLGIRYYDFIAVGENPNGWNLSSNKFKIDIDTLFNYSWQKFVFDNNCPTYKYGHPTVESHKIWSDKIAERIK